MNGIKFLILNNSQHHKSIFDLIILCKPLDGQPEQEHNAKILNDLGYATISKTIDINSINNWLHSSKKIKIDFPNPLKLIIDIIENKNKDFSYEIDKLWQIKKTY